VLAGLVDGPVMVDNDVNWAARAERDATDSQQLDDFAYLHLGEGLGCAVVNDGVVRRGHAGLVGEIAHVLTNGPDGRAVPLIDVFGALEPPPSCIDGIDVPALLAAVEPDDAPARDLRATLARAICGVLAAVAAFCDPATRHHRRHVGPSARRPRHHRRAVRATRPPCPDPGRATHRRTLSRRRQEPRTPRASGGHRNLHPIALSRNGLVSARADPTPG
jgi:predicted NBD/HSP70 family sugar kinase